MPSAPRPETQDTARTERGRWALALAALLVALAFVTWGRIHVTLNDRNFDAEHAEGMLRSDPGLVYYITERIIEAGGLPPADFRADTRVAHPESADLPAMFTVAQEFLVAWTWLAFGQDVPLHLFAVYVMSLVASLTALGVFGLTYELTRHPLWAALAALLYAVLLYNYRTVGFILIREDLSLPAFSLHLWLLARGARLRSSASFLLCALALVLALASWHAMGFVFLIEVAVFFAWFVRSAESPFDLRHSWIVFALLLLASLAVPVLSAKGFWLSPAMAMSAALFAASLARTRGLNATRRRLTALATLAAMLVIGRLSGGQQDYAHVASFLVAKLEHLGRIPTDPNTIPFDVRLLWQGPFTTARLSDFTGGLGVGTLALALLAAFGLPNWLRGKGTTLACLSAFAAGCLLSGWLVSRTLILGGFFAPVAAAVLLARLPSARLGMGLLGLAVAGQAVFLFQRVARMDRSYIAWYAEIPDRNVELARLVRWAEENLPAHEPVVSDYMTSTALLAHNRNPIVCQPKYETASSRRRIEEFVEAYINGSPEDFRAFIKRYGCRYVVIDRLDNWWLCGYLAGYPFREVNSGPPPEGSAAAIFGSVDDATLTSVPGFRLIYRAPPRFRTDFFRVYEVD